MDAVNLLRGESSALTKLSDNFKFDLKYDKKSLPNITSYIPLEESYT